MYRATWLLPNGDRVRSRDYLSLDQIADYTFEGERVLALEALESFATAHGAFGWLITIKEV